MPKTTTQRKVLGQNRGGAPSTTVTARGKGKRDARQQSLPPPVGNGTPLAAAPRDTLLLDRHGTVGAPYVRKRGGGATRQTTVAIPTDLDEQLQTYYVRVGRKRYPTKTQLWLAALRLFLAVHNGESAPHAEAST